VTAEAAADAEAAAVSLRELDSRIRELQEAVSASERAIRQQVRVMSACMF
jgi:hypothetical protein